ncbi:MAG: amidohydrolase family protein [Myxococcales bacterium]|nr:amidohydrolase family protein [Myxococcales bacterium]
MRWAALGLVAAAGLSANAAAAPPPRWVDAHTHLSSRSMERAHRVMDQVGIDWAVNLSGGWPGGPLEESMDAAKASGRELVCTNLPWAAARRFPRFPEGAAKLIREAAGLGARCLKIEKALGLVVKKPDGTRVAVDDPWLDPIWETAGAIGMPVLIHTADPEAFWRPVDEHNERRAELTAHPAWSYVGREVPPFADLLDELMRVVARHPDTIFVAVHFGNRAEDPFWVAEQLERYPNLYVDVAARVPELGRHDPEKLRQVFLRFQDRILFGTDLGVSGEDFLMLGSFGEEPNRPEELVPFFDAHHRWFETRDTMPSPTPIQGEWQIYGIGLPDEVLEKIYVRNAVRLFGPPPAKATTWRMRPPYFRAE